MPLQKEFDGSASPTRKYLNKGAVGQTVRRKHVDEQIGVFCLSAGVA